MGAVFGTSMPSSGPAVMSFTSKRFPSDEARWGSQGQPGVIQVPCWRRRPAWMGIPLSEDLRVRVIRAVEEGASRRQAAARFGVGVATAIRWLPSAGLRSGGRADGRRRVRRAVTGARSGSRRTPTFCWPGSLRYRTRAWPSCARHCCASAASPWRSARCGGFSPGAGEFIGIRCRGRRTPGDKSKRLLTNPT